MDRRAACADCGQQTECKCHFPRTAVSLQRPAYERSDSYYENKCRFQFNCWNGLTCQFSHTMEENIFFKKNGGRGNPNRKTELCRHYPHCERANEDCDYAHGEKDAWCRSCKMNGHFMKPTCNTASLHEEDDEEASKLQFHDGTTSEQNEHMKCLEKVTFTRGKLQRSGKDLESRIKVSGVFVVVNKREFPNRTLNRDWIEKVVNIAQSSFDYYWVGMDKTNEATDTLCLIFKSQSFHQQIDDILSAIESCSAALYIIDKPYQYLSGEKLDHIRSSGEPISSTQECPYKFNCIDGLSCGQKHNDDEVKFFASNNVNPYRKVQLCRYFADGDCLETKEDCPYAHGEEDAWCLSCKSNGHFTDNCNVHHVHQKQVLDQLDCADCGQLAGQWPLACQDHVICTKCCTARASNKTLYPKNYCNCQPIWIFVDNSNIWIAAKSYIAKSKGFQKVKEDPRVRIEFGNLIDVIGQDRKIAKCFLFGSEPPQVDSVWQKGEENGFKVIIDLKSRSGKEKKVDVRLCIEALTTVQNCNRKQKTKGTIVLATGDADFIPLVEKILKEDGWKVEVVTWKHALSDDFLQLEKDFKCCFKLHYLDEDAKMVTFTEYHSKTYSYPIGAICVEIDEEKLPDEKSCQDWCDMVGCYTPCLFHYRWINQKEMALIYPVNYHEEFKAAVKNKSHLGIKSFRTPKKVIECEDCCRYKSSEECPYAHGSEDASCLLCDDHHFTHEH